MNFSKKQRMVLSVALFFFSCILSFYMTIQNNRPEYREHPATYLLGAAMPNLIFAIGFYWLSGIQRNQAKWKLSSDSVMARINFKWLLVGTTIAGAIAFVYLVNRNSTLVLPPKSEVWEDAPPVSSFDPDAYLASRASEVREHATSNKIPNTAEVLAEEQVRVASSLLPMPFGQGITLVGLRSRGSIIIYDLKLTAARGSLSNIELEALMQGNLKNQCADPTARNLLAQGVSMEMKFNWSDGLTSSININPNACGVIKGEVNAAHGASVKEMVEQLSPKLPIKIDKDITLASVSQVEKMGLKYTYIFDTHGRKINASQLETIRLSAKDEVCNDALLSTLMRGGVKLIFSYQAKAGKLLTEAVITNASCNK